MQYDRHYEQTVGFSAKPPYETIISSANEDLYSSMLRVIVGVVSVISAILVATRFKYELKLLKVIGEINYKEGFFSSKRRLFQLFVEIISLCIFLPPKINAVDVTTQHDLPIPISLDMTFTIVMLPRMVYILRSYISFFSYIYQRHIGFEHVVKKYNVHPASFIARAHFKFYPYTSLSLGITILMINIGLCLRIPERAFVYFSNKDWDSVSNNFWNVIVVITSVGYGDFYPSTHFGRFFTVISAILGTFFISMMVLIMADNITFNRFEKKAYTKIKEHEIMEKFQREAAVLDFRALRLNWFLAN